MKNVIALAVLMITTASFAVAQDYGKLVKKAKRALNTYYLDQNNNEKDLMEARDLVQQAFEESNEATNDFDAQFYRGKIFAEVFARENAKLLSDPNYQLSDPELPFKSFESLKGALELADKGWKEKDVLDAMIIAAVNLSNTGIRAFQEQDFDKAYNAFLNTLEIKNTLSNNGKGDAYLAKDEDLQNQKYYTALAAQLSGKNDKANELYKELLNSGFKTAEVYEGLYRINSESNPEEAIKYLEEGRQMYPDSTNLLYAEINYYLKEGNIESLEDKLKLGIEKDPQNASLHITLGNVYDRLYQKAVEQGNKEKGDDYFNKAIQKYENAIEIDPELNDAYYSVGALYYNKAAEISKQMQELENDYSKEGLKKYETLNKKVLGNFDKALPWFKKSEKKEPNDVNTLIALKEIYAKKGDLELSQTFTDRLNQVRSGESLESYFSE
ncbi:MAG TPA: tetratricopeptide repeat protein [Saprospiraceae bacterium]|nr:tetratricopeptide repeat protein [Saprospiraceae bacterium]